jgi:serine/threonine-protein kinase RsbW
MTPDTSSIEHAPVTSAMRLRLHADAENVMLARQAIDGAARQIGADTAVIDDAKLAVTEACSNVVKYAYANGDAASGTIELTFDPLPDGFVVTISDDGQWLERDPGSEKAGGLGIPLMEAVTRDCEIRSDGQGTSVRLEFELERVND